ncbi:hypothetical protein [uncultured Shewanella sp.]|uniref:hypothetical protein n=1 Tax=uncultured Shewanella sp. TaxID=173975 RepID=UPI0026175C79|nr:hypothetical protein [uncultured Shewanella sp.]
MEKLMIILRSFLQLFLLAITTLAVITNSHGASVGKVHEPFIGQNPLIGSWLLVSGAYLNDKNQWIDYRDLNLTAIKVISKTHFSFTTMKLESAVQTFWAAGTGKYQLTKQHYIEFPTLNSFNVKQGESFKFSYHIDGNEWHTKRYEGGQLSEKEVWKKLD